MSIACFVFALVYTKLDRWFVSVQGIPGFAIVKSVEQIRTLPERMWEVTIEVFPEDIPNLMFQRTMQWTDSEFQDRTPMPEPNGRLPIRFRRAPRPLVMPMKILPWTRNRTK
ncbi:hypothetical protein HNQ77_004156 [Silvibacterium bohemicum]|uniref:Uncharacterized protein n=1 Tax=Silvibacterium bohemicum TaxID=1577686 RepID=A0A841K7D9_9BACT|nr:hypothetical protein [Silvibacterium bohemicum]